MSEVKRSKNSTSNKISKHLNYMMFPESLKNFVDSQELTKTFSHEFVSSFEPVKKENIFGNEYDQSVDSYILSRKRRRKPNPIEVERKKIILAKVLLSKKKEVLSRYDTIIGTIRDMMESYFQVDVQVDNNFSLHLKKIKNCFKIVDSRNQNTFPIEYNKTYNNFSVFGFLDILHNYTNDDTLSLIIFTDLNIHEGNPKVEIFGRVLNLSKNFAVVSLNNELDSETIITALHETMHTFGFSHCKSFNCIMNAKNDSDNYSCISLCPVDMIKLKVFNPKLDFKKRYYDLEKQYTSIGWDEDAKETKLKIEILNKLR